MRVLLCRVGSDSIPTPEEVSRVAFSCGVSFGACMVRITKVDENGNVIAGQNSYVSDKPISISVNPNIETGNSFSVRNGCGCSISRRKFPDTFNWWELSLNMEIGRAA